MAKTTFVVDDWNGTRRFKTYADLWKDLRLDPKSDPFHEYEHAELIKEIRRDLKKDGCSQFYRGQECVDIWKE